jgi:phosphoserine phosphatase RsbU/P
MMAGLIDEGSRGLVESAAWLVPVSGPPLDAVRVAANEVDVVLGRGDTAQIKLPMSADKVSRKHCRFACVDGRWTLTDSSKWGTFVNGIKLLPEHAVELREGDHVRVSPWTFRLQFSAPAAGGSGLELDDDTAGGSEVRAVDENLARNLGVGLLDVLTVATEVLCACPDERKLAEELIELALKGTGLSNAAVLKVVDASGRVEVLASRMAAGTTGQALYSRSLVARARQGQVAELRVDSMSGGVGESVMQMKISSAICAPLLLGESSTPAGERDVAALLYVDARGTAPDAKTHPNAAAFVMALARIGSLALANLQRIAFGMREKEMEFEVKAAASAAATILPPRTGRHGVFTYQGQCRPGTNLSGDFFDVVHLPDGRFAVALGDVTGKGIAASVLMTTSFGYLHSQLEAGAPPAESVARLSRFILPRKRPDRFVTLWLGVFDPKEKTLTYVDCGHGWAGMAGANGGFAALDGGGGVACGVMEDWVYEPVTLPLPDGSKVVIVSDGFVEQFGLVVDAVGQATQEQYGMKGVAKSLLRTPGEAGVGGDDDIKAMFDAVIAYAGTDKLADDATAIVVQWE